MRKAMVLLLLLFAAGCGGDDDDGQGSYNPLAPTGVTSPGMAGQDLASGGVQAGTIPDDVTIRNLTMGSETCWISRFEPAPNGITVDYRGDTNPNISYVNYPFLSVDLDGNACGLGHPGNRLASTVVRTVAP